MKFLNEIASPELEIRFKAPGDVNNDNAIYKIKLHKATAEGCWWKATTILKNHKDAYEDVIDDNGNTMLHLAVKMGHNSFVENLLNFIQEGNKIETKNHNGQTALHVSAMVDNKYAAQLLVQKRKELMDIVDQKAHTPLVSAYNSMKFTTYVYLLEMTDITKRPRLSQYPEAYVQNGVKLLINAIFMKQYGE